MTTNNAVSGALERPNPEVCARSALSTHYTSPCATIVALFDNWQAVVRTDRSPSFHPASSLAPFGKYEREGRGSVLVGPVGLGQSVGCAASGAFRQAPGGADANDSLASRLSSCSVQCQTKMEDLIHVANQLS